MDTGSGTDLPLADVANQVLARCGSTNDLARRLGDAGYPHGAWVSTRIQDAGRGRMGRRWESNEGNLFLSIVLRLPATATWTWVPLTGAVMTAAALRELDPRLDVRIKWPNDLWIGGAKLGGFLTEAVGNRERSFIVLGIGVNCRSAPEGLDQAAISLSAAAGGTPIDADDVRLPIVASVLEGMSRLQTEGPGFMAALYERWAAIPPGVEITWGSKTTTADGAIEGRGSVLGLGESGELRVLDASGAERRLYAEDVRIRTAPR